MTTTPPLVRAARREWWHPRWRLPSIALSPTARGALVVLAAALAFSTLGSLSGVAYRSGMGSATFVTLRAVIGAGLLAMLLLLRPGSRVSLRSRSRPTSTPS